MNKKIQIFGFVVVSFMLFIAFHYIFNKDFKAVHSSDLQNAEDWFYFVWLFIVPIFIFFFAMVFPFNYLLVKPDNSENKRHFYFALLSVFAIEFAISYWLYGFQYSVIKVAISITLFIVFFRKTVIAKLKPLPMT